MHDIQLNSDSPVHMVKTEAERLSHYCVDGSMLTNQKSYLGLSLNQVRHLFAILEMKRHVRWLTLHIGYLIVKLGLPEFRAMNGPKVDFTTLFFRE